MPGRNGAPMQLPPRRLMVRPMDSNLSGNYSAEIKEDGSFTLTRMSPGTYVATIPSMGSAAGGAVYVQSMTLGRTNFTLGKLDLKTGIQGETPLVVHV